LSTTIPLAFDKEDVVHFTLLTKKVYAAAVYSAKNQYCGDCIN